MDLAIHEIGPHNLADAGRCDGTFTVAARLVLAATDNVIQSASIPITPYQKRYPVEPVDYTAYIDSPERTVYFAYLGSQIAGEIRLRQNWNRYAYIEDLVVDRHFRRRGIGRALIEKAVEWARNKHLPGVMLETQNNNVAAYLLYQQCGFELAGFDRLLYQGQFPESEEIALYWYRLFQSEKE